MIIRPPILGVGKQWEDCRAKEVCPLAVWLICKGFVHKTINEAIQPAKIIYKLPIVMIAILKFPKIIKINVTQYEKISLQNKYLMSDSWWLKIVNPWNLAVSYDIKDKIFQQYGGILTHKKRCILFINIKITVFSFSKNTCQTRTHVAWYLRSLISF